MHNFLILKILDYFRPLLEKFQLDYPLLRHFLAVKLVMDQRRSSTLFEDADKKEGNPFFRSLWLYALYGIILIFFIYGEAYMLQMSIIFGVALFILMTSLIADFSPVLLDTRDKAILDTKPVDAKTIAVAKFIHIFIYFILLVGSFAIIPILFMLFVQGLFFTVLFVVMLMLFLVFTMALTSLVYILVLKLFSGTSLRNTISYIQILFAIGIIVGYQLIIRTYGYVDTEMMYVFKWWHAVLPPFWFAAPFELVMNQNTSASIIVLSCMSLVIPIAAMGLYYYYMPTLEKNIQKLQVYSNTSQEKSSFIERFWGNVLCRTEDDRVYFQFVYRMIQREREFKLKVYPALGIGVVLPFIFLFSLVGTVSQGELADSLSYLYIYVMHLFIGIALYTFQFSGSFKGAWLFKASGGGKTTPLYKAVLKVFWVKLYTPMFLVVATGYILLFSQMTLLDAAAVFLSAIVQSLLSYWLLMKSDYPFALPFEKAQEAGSSVQALLLMLVVLPFVLLHFLSTLVVFGTGVYLLLLFAGSILLWKIAFPAQQPK